MAYEEKVKAQVGTHSVIMDSRSRVSVTGVEDVESFDEICVVMMTVRGPLTVRGEELHLEKLNLDSGEIIIEGTINVLEYEEDSVQTKEGFFSRIFG